MASHRTSEIELIAYPVAPGSHLEANDVYPQSNNLEDRTSFSLPPVDSGRPAWSFLAGAFFIEALVWGFPFSFGVFQDYYSRTPPFDSPHQKSRIAIIGTTALGIMYLGAPSHSRPSSDGPNIGSRIFRSGSSSSLQPL